VELATFTVAPILTSPLIVIFELPRDTGNGLSKETGVVDMPVRTTAVAGCGRGLKDIRLYTSYIHCKNK
jgi:hypothetical protein